MIERDLGEEEVRSIIKILDYFYGRGAGRVFRGARVTGLFSKRTGRLRRVLLNGKEVLVIRAADFTPLLTKEGLRLIGPLARRVVVVKGGTEGAIRRARNVFCKHVVGTQSNIKPRDEVVVVGEGGGVLAVGKAVLPGEHMLRFKSGVAVMVRRGLEDVSHKPEGN